MSVAFLTFPTERERAKGFVIFSREKHGNEFLHVLSRDGRRVTVAIFTVITNHLFCIEVVIRNAWDRANKSLRVGKKK